MKRFTQIAGLSEARRLPRIGKLRLGMKTLSRGGKEIPKELDYFLLPEPGPDDPASAHEAYRRFQSVYGEKPRDLEVVIPSEDPAAFFPQRYKCYGSSGLRCIGDGTAAERIGSAMGKAGDEAAEFFEVSCPTPDECEFAQEHGCRPVGSLYVILPRVSLGGCFQIDVSGINSMLNINSAVEHVRTLCGRVSGLIFRKAGAMRAALCLKRVPIKTQGGGHVATHYPITLELQLSLSELEEFLGRGAPALPTAPSAPALPEPDEEELPFVPDESEAGEEEGALGGNRETAGRSEKERLWDAIEELFSRLNTPPNMREAYLKRFGAAPDQLLAVLQKRLEDKR